VIRPRRGAGTADARRPWLRTAIEVAAAAAGAVLVYLVVTLPFGFAEVWDQSFRYRADAATDRDPAGNAAKILSTLWDRDLVLLAFLLVSAAWATRRWILVRRRPPAVREPSGAVQASGSPSPQALVVVWMVVTWLWLVFMVSPLWRPHVSAMVPPLVLVVALWRPPIRVLLITGVACVPLLWLQLDDLLRPGGYTGGEAEVVAALEDLPDGAWALSDEPGLVWRAGRRTTDDLVDPSMLRVRQGRYTEDSVVEAADDRRVCAVVIRSPERFGSFPGLPERLGSLGYELVARDVPEGALYVRTACAPS
jgi:hypothetical protein